MEKLANTLNWYSLDQRKGLSQTNLNIGLITFLMATLYAIISLTLTIFNPNRHMLNGINNWTYDITLIVWTLSGLIIGLGMKFTPLVKTEIGKILHNNLTLYYSIFLYFSFTYIYLIKAEDKVKPLLAFGIIVITCTLLAQLNPYVLTFIYIGLTVLTIPIISVEIGQAEGVLSTIFMMLQMVFVFIRALYLKANYDKTQQLKAINQETSSKYIAELQRNNEMQKNTIIKLAELIESRDNSTGSHIKRTSKSVQYIAEELVREGKFVDLLTPEYIMLITDLSMLHDVGKIRISDTILNAPRALTASEFETMKKHTLYGKEIVNNIIFGQEDDYQLKDIAEELAYCHHEKWNGKGYPEGLSGEDIPVCARIMAVADVYDALISKRCYKASISKREALQIIKDSSGIDFDPDIVEAFLNIQHFY